jgi:DNA-directed RNA polymerase subunit RPC12/RpoP
MAKKDDIEINIAVSKDTGEVPEYTLGFIVIKCPGCGERRIVEITSTHLFYNRYNGGEILDRYSNFKFDANDHNCTTALINDSNSVYTFYAIQYIPAANLSEEKIASLSRAAEYTAQFPAVEYTPIKKDGKILCPLCKSVMNIHTGVCTGCGFQFNLSDYDIDDIIPETDINQ